MTDTAAALSGARAQAQTQASFDLAASVEASGLQTSPFDHIYMEHAFPPAFYQTLIENRPESRRFHQLKHPQALRADGTSTRLRFYLYPENLRALSPKQRAAWLPVSKALMSQRLQDAFKRKFKQALEARFGRSIGQLAFYPVPILVRDLPGYRIGIHSDTLKKAITAQFYLPRDASQRHLGTAFHEGSDSETAVEVKRMAFMPASGYAFAVVKEASWHSVPQTGDADGERDSLMLTYYVQDKPRTWIKQRTRRIGALLGFPPEA